MVFHIIFLNERPEMQRQLDLTIEETKSCIMEFFSYLDVAVMILSSDNQTDTLENNYLA